MTSSTCRGAPLNEPSESPASAENCNQFENQNDAPHARTGLCTLPEERPFRNDTLRDTRVLSMRYTVVPCCARKHTRKAARPEDRSKSGSYDRAGLENECV